MIMINYDDDEDRFLTARLRGAVYECGWDPELRVLNGIARLGWRIRKRRLIAPDGVEQGIRAGTTRIPPLRLLIIWVMINRPASWLRLLAADEPWKNLERETKFWQEQHLRLSLEGRHLRAARKMITRALERKERQCGGVSGS